MLKIKSVLLGFALLLGLVAPASLTLALEGDGSSTGAAEQQSLEQKKEEWRQLQLQKQAEAKKKREAIREEKLRLAEEKKLEARKTACENKKESLAKRFSGITKRSEERKGKFARIGENVEKFVTDNNLTVENYSTLIADIEAKKTALVDAHNSAKAIAEEFDCENPSTVKEDLTAYKTAVKAELEAFKAYKTSLKALVKAVKEAAEPEETEADNTGEQSGEQEQNNEN